MGNETEDEPTQTAVDLGVRFGDRGEPFTMHLYDNDMAAAIARHVGTSDWRLPIYHYDDYDNWEVMQYYDIPSRYEIPSDPEQVTEEKAGCSQDTVECCIACLDCGKKTELLKRLENHRKSLLRKVHEGEKQINCLDYLVYQIGRCGSNS